MLEHGSAKLPYPGLRPFEPFEADVFFGRETHTDALLEILQRERFLAVTGPSGSGKSSLALAGMLPAIAAGWLGTGSLWRLVRLRPGDRPIHNLASALLAPHALGPELAARTDSPTHLLSLIDAELNRGSLGLSHVARNVQPPDAPFNLLVLVDQFEELFRYIDAGQRQVNQADAFVELLLQACAGTETRIFVVLTMRSDFLGNCTRFYGLAERINQTQYLTPRLTRAQLLQAIVAPARVFGGDIDPEVANELINQISGDQDQLPILQHALARMWESAARRNPESPRIAAAELRETGGLARALDKQADEVFASLSAPQRSLAEHLFRSITERKTQDDATTTATGGGFVADIRRPQPLGEIVKASPTPTSWRDFVPIIEAFSRSGVNFIVHTQPLDEKARIDISHEALIRKWRRLQEWVKDEAEKAADYRRWRGLARYGETIGTNLDRAVAWKDGTASWKPTPQWAWRYDDDKSGVSFAETINHIERSEWIRFGKRLIAPGFALLMTLVAIGIFRQWWHTQQLLIRIAFQEAVHLLEPDRDAESLAYLAEAMNHSPDAPEARRTLASLLLYQRWPLPATEPLRHAKPVRVATFSPDGKLVATASDDGTAQLWNAQTGELASEPLQHDGRVSSVVFSSDGKHVLTASDDSTARLWNTDDGALLATMKHDGPVRSAVFSPDRSLILTASDDRTARLWDGNSGKQVGESVVHCKQVEESLNCDEVSVAAFNPKDGETFATGFSDSKARIWRTKSRELVAELNAEHASGKVSVSVLAYSPDGTRLVTASEAGSTYLWDAKGSELAPLIHGGRVRHVAFTSDSRRLVTASLDGKARLWDADGKPVGEPMNHPAGVWYAVFNADGSGLWTAAHDGRVRFWDGANGSRQLDIEPMLHDGAVYTIAVHPKKQQLVTASHDATAQIWNLPARAAAPRFEGHPATDPGLTAQEAEVHLGQVRANRNVSAAALSGDRTKIVTAFKDGAVRLSDASTGAVIGELPSQNDVTEIAIDPTGTIVVAASDNGTVKISDTRTRIVTADLSSQRIVDRLRFTPDGKTFIAACEDGTIQIFDARTGTLIADLPEQRNVRTIAFSPDQSKIVVASDDGVVRLSDGHTGALIGELPKHEGSVSRIVFNQTGERFVTAASDVTSGLLGRGRNLARVWDTSSGKAVGAPMVHDGSVVAIAFSSDDAWIVTAWESDPGREMRFWEASSGVPISRPIGLLASCTPLADIAFGEKFVTVACGTSDGTYVVPGLAEANQGRLAQIAEVIGGRALQAEGLIGPTANRYQALVALRNEYVESTRTDELTKVMRWFFDRAPGRSAAPL